MPLRASISPVTCIVRSPVFYAGSNPLLLFAGYSGRRSIDLSRATRLKDIVVLVQNVKCLIDHPALKPSHPVTGISNKS